MVHIWFPRDLPVVIVLLEAEVVALEFFANLLNFSPRLLRINTSFLQQNEMIGFIMISLSQKQRVQLH